MGSELELKYKLPVPCAEMEQRLLAVRYEQTKFSHEVDDYYVVNEELSGPPEGSKLDVTSCVITYGDSSIDLSPEQASEFKAMYDNMYGKSYLRIRHDLERVGQDGEYCVTYKRKTEDKNDRKEFEVKVTPEQASKFRELFENAYMMDPITVDKVRKTFMRDERGYEVCLDEVQELGDFTEFENKGNTPVEELNAAASELLLTEVDRVPELKYADMMKALRNT